jgi:hypothetical protein
MKHIELFENFSQMGSGQTPMTLKPLDVSMVGDSVVFFLLGDDMYVTLSSSNKAERMVQDIRSIMTNSLGEPDEEFESSLMIINQPGIAYVLFEPEEEPYVSVKGKWFEDQTTEIDFWGTGTPSDELSNPNGPGEYNSSVSVLKRDMVISLNAGSQPSSNVFTISEFLQDLESNLD